jgi:hypothetical protein
MFERGGARITEKMNEDGPSLIYLLLISENRIAFEILDTP